MARTPAPRRPAYTGRLGLRRHWAVISAADAASILQAWLPDHTSAFASAEPLGVKAPTRYLTLVTDYLAALNGPLSREYADCWTALTSPDALLSYTRWRAMPRPRLRPWAARTQANNLSLLRTALEYCHLPSPRDIRPTQLKRVAKSLVKSAPHEGLQVRGPVPLQLVRLAMGRLRGRPASQLTTQASAILAFSTYALMRAGEALSIVAVPGRLSVEPSALVAWVHDKTHDVLWRKLLWKPTQLLGDSTEFEATAARARSLLNAYVKSPEGRPQLFSSAAWKLARGELRRASAMTMGSLRASGVLLHLRLGTDPLIIKALAGWSEKSSVWVNHYLDAAAALAAEAVAAPQTTTSDRCEHASQDARLAAPTAARQSGFLGAQRTGAHTAAPVSPDRRLQRHPATAIGPSRAQHALVPQTLAGSGRALR